VAQKLWGDDNSDSEPLETESTYGPPSLREFDVSLENFTGPFDLLLRLIARRQMDLTQIALAAVTDEFLAYIRKQPDLSSATDFLVVAATLLHMKAAALLPKNAVEDDVLDEDLEARDLLFARLLQYRALQQAAEVLAKQWDKHAGTVARSVPLQEPYASRLPELRWTASPEFFASLAANALAEKPRPDEAQHVGRPAASFDEQLDIVRARLEEGSVASFADLVQDASNSAVVVTRFLALLQLYRQGNLAFHQDDPMATLRIEWVPPTPGAALVASLQNGEVEIARGSHSERR
jgi:segregation and condensation protein A